MNGIAERFGKRFRRSCGAHNPEHAVGQESYRRGRHLRYVNEDGLATSSNNLAKTVYALVYSNGQLRASAAALALLSACGIALAVLD